MTILSYATIALIVAFFVLDYFEKRSPRYVWRLGASSGVALAIVVIDIIEIANDVGGVGNIIAMSLWSGILFLCLNRLIHQWLMIPSLYGAALNEREAREDVEESFIFAARNLLETPRQWEGEGSLDK